MAKAIAQIRAQNQHSLDPFAVARAAIVLGCALALAAAGPVLPALGL
ncbi:hypothetical protein [Qipengyuania marisflavi]|nr:hypothetical protein [Qipengyuania marisflavi]